MALKWGDFASQGALGDVCRHFWLSHHGVLTVGEQRMFNRVIAEHPPMHRADPGKRMIQSEMSVLLQLRAPL